MKSQRIKPKYLVLLISHTPPKEKTINGVTGYEIYASNNRNTFAYHFITESGDRYVDV